MLPSQSRVQLNCRAPPAAFPSVLSRAHGTRHDEFATTCYASCELFLRADLAGLPCAAAAARRPSPSESPKCRFAKHFSRARAPSTSTWPAASYAQATGANFALVSGRRLRRRSRCPLAYLSARWPGGGQVGAQWPDRVAQRPHRRRARARLIDPQKANYYVAKSVFLRLFGWCARQPVRL